MALQVWLPLLGATTAYDNQGVSGLTFDKVPNTSGSGILYSTAGKIGHCCGNDHHTYGGLISNTTINLGQKQSMFCWFKATSFSSGSSLGGALISQHRYPNNTGMGITFKYVSGTTAYLSVNTGNGSSRTYNTYCGTTLLQAGTWYHGGYTYDGSTLNIYVNGVCEYTGSISGMSVPADYITIFCWSMANSSGSDVYASYKFDGYINDARVYDHCLSPKEVKELSKGLIAHFPLADPYVEYTTNIVTVQKYESGASTGWGGHSAVTSDYDSTNDPVPSNTISKITCTYSGSGGGGFGYRAQSVTVSPSTTYTYSAYVKTEDDFASANANILYRYEYPGTPSSPGTKITETGCYSASNRQSLGNGWYRCWGTFATNSATNCVQLYFYGYPNKNCNYWVGCWQLEQKDHMTPYVLGSRNGSSAITVYDASGYKNNGVSQVNYGLAVDTNSIRHKYCTYFGTGLNNYIRAPITISTALNTITMTAWIRSKNGTAGGGGYHMPLNINDQQYEFSIDSGGYFRNGFVCNSSRVVNTTPGPNIISDKKWHMIAATYDGATIRRYVDGVEVQTQSASGNLSGGSKVIYSGTYGTGATYYTKELYESDLRIYATALSASDIKELYEVSGHIDKTGKLYSYELVEV